MRLVSRLLVAGLAAQRLLRAVDTAALPLRRRAPRSGVRVNLEFRPTAATQLSLRTTFNRFQDREGRDLSAFDFAGGTLTNRSETGGTFSGGRASIQFRGYEQRHTIANRALSGKHTAGPNVFDFTASTGLAEKLTPSRIESSRHKAASKA